ncbi:MAG: hypothetical protein NVSMB17_16050 [Candidatus Dormibacteria bacterium]
MKIRILAASATLAAASLLSPHAARAATPSPQAGKALQYLSANQQQDGSIDTALGETADYTLGAAFHGIDPTTLKASPSNKSVYDYFTGWVAASVSCSAVSNTRDGNSIGKLVQAVVVGKLDPTSFGGRNLLADLEGPAGTTGGAYDASTGTFQDCASFDSKTGAHQNAVYAQANAILGLQAAKNPLYPVLPAAIQRLRALQDASGGWPVFGVDSSNSTAMALMALAGVLQPTCTGPDPTLTSALAYLHTQVDPASGGFVYSSAYGTSANPAVSDPDSDAVGIQALVAVGQDPAGTTWTNPKGNPTTDILTFQDQASGGFKFDHAANTTPDAFTTSQVPAGLDRAPFPGGTTQPLAVAACAPSPTATPLAVASAVPTAAPALPRAGAGAAGPGRAPIAGFTVLLLLSAAVLTRRLVCARRAENV